MKVVTVINDKTNLGFCLLRLSCHFHRLDLVALVSSVERFTTNRIKDNLLKSYLSDLEDPDEIILFTDGNDAIFLADEEEILMKFYQFKKDVLFSAETNCWPDSSLSKQYPDFGSTIYCYLNSGGFIGRAGVIRDLLNDPFFDAPEFPWSNQYWWTKKYFKHHGEIAIDIACDIFQTFSPELGEDYYPSMENPDFRPYYRFMKKWFLDSFSICKGRILNKATGSYPCHAHFNGKSKYLVDNDVIDMILAIDSEYKNVRFFYEREEGGISYLAI
ncbi:MAG TPA: hypothetical protein VNS58_17160 [Puia sp.]|nr:hypothetical protein [Puia sp.]